VSLGDACALPIRSDAADAATVGWGLRNVPDIDQAHSEILRVLKPGGRFASIDMAVPRNRLGAKLSRFVFHSLVPRLGYLFGRAEAYTYLPQSTERFSTREQLADSMARAGFTDIHFEDLFFGNICVHFGRKPQTS
jgi:demethylmenaquinone methyltransferase / 2-methoxy-6-polyprenyl-1,4-benzoquinol methylase